MKLLIIGSGAREHALGSFLAKEGRELYFAPGNGGTSALGTNVDISPTDLDGLLKFAKEKDMDYTVVGPEDPLVAGVADLFREEGLKIFGPGKEGARLEGSKAYTKEFLSRHNIPTADYFIGEDLSSAREKALAFLEEDHTVVLKADGLCAGKGVVLAKTPEDVEEFLEDLFLKGKYGLKKVVVERFLPGFEVSCLCFTDGKTLLPLASSRDHKKAFDGERGPNTGGMGTYSPNGGADVYQEEIRKKILVPFVEGLQKDGIDYRGLIFIGCMITDDGVSVLEFNVRFGDPETQSVLHRLGNDLLEVMEATSEGRLSEITLEEKEEKVVTLVLASRGYPESYEKGKVITGLDRVKDVAVYHAGTREEGGKVLTNGGRVLSLTATGDTFAEAIEKVYAAAEVVDFPGKTYRKDIGPKVFRVYVCKKDPFNNEGKALRKEWKTALGLPLEKVRVYKRYDIEDLPEEELPKVIDTVLSEPPVDVAFSGEEAFALERDLSLPFVVEYLPGQFDQRNQSMIDTVAVAAGYEVKGRCATVYELIGNLSKGDRDRVKDYAINPVDQVEGTLRGVPTTLETPSVVHRENPVYDGFRALTLETAGTFVKDHGLAMSPEDLLTIVDHYKTLDRDPNEVELFVLDTYWSDHCRHTTFNTELTPVSLARETALDETVRETYEKYLALHEKCAPQKKVSLMDLGTIVARDMRGRGTLEDVEVSEEINACSVEVTATIEDYEGRVKEVPYLFMFKNETHNHPTEVEPYGGASTCLGGAIRDPLSGRSYVYQAMRVTGAGNVKAPVEETLEGKLPQKKITREAMLGYSSYGNQIGLATGHVDEWYHPGFVAKRMEVGAVLGAAPRENVLRATPAPGDLVLLLGGRTGRDGVGGATGSSKGHDKSSIVQSSAEVQKGNAPMERKLQRLFRKAEVAKKIKKCNDFGAGGVAVAIGELADSLEIHLDKVPLKYTGLTPKEIAISESQERMAVVIAPEDREFFLEECEKENLEATVVAEVTDTGYMEMFLEGETVLKLSREFLDSTGAPRIQGVKTLSEEVPERLSPKKEGNLKEILTSLNGSAKRNLTQHFDSTIGKNTVLAPFGGKTQSTPVRGMVAALPTLEGASRTVSLMTYGYNPYLSEESQFLGGYYAVVESLANFAALGGDPLKARLSFQEYFQKLGEEDLLWGKPLKSLLGAFKATEELQVPPIGGKDSMSGTFEDLHVPPTLISFAAGVADLDRVISPELKGKGRLGLIETPRKEDGTLDLNAFKENLKLLEKDNILAAMAINHHGVLPAAFAMAIGNDLSFTLEEENLYGARYGSFLVEYVEDRGGIRPIGTIGGEKTVVNGETIDLEELKRLYLTAMDDVFTPEKEGPLPQGSSSGPRRLRKCKKPVEVPKVVIPAFPGTNCEWDTLDAFRREGADGEIVVLNNLDLDHLSKSIDTLAEKISQAQILAIPGGFSLGDEPDGSGKFIANVLRNEKVSAAIEKLLTENDGLILGICNGFQALIKTGLLPYGEVRDLEENSPTLTFNDCGRHIARFVTTRTCTTDSPWMMFTDVTKDYILPISHGEGRFVCDEETYEKLLENDQIATVYDRAPNGSAYAVEGILSPDGKILGKMGHTERVAKDRCINIPGQEIQPILRAGVAYMKGERP